MTGKKLNTIIALSIILPLLAVILYFSFIKSANFSLETALSKPNLVPVVIIGAGPAGLSAATWTARAQLRTIVFAGHEPGGQLNQAATIENWPGRKKMAGGDLVKELETQAQKFGAYIINSEVKKIDLNTWPFVIVGEEGLILHALSLIIATGGETKILNVPGAQKYMGRGIGICTICDAPFNKDQDVVVIGSDDPAAERALQLAAYAKKVTMISPKKKLEACATAQDYLKATKNIEFILNADVVEIIGDGTNAIGLIYKDKSTHTPSTIHAKTIFFSLGYTPSSELVKDYVKTDKDGFIVVDGKTQATSIPGVFAAGNVEDRIYGKAGIAAGDGIRAALDTIMFLESIGLNPGLAHEKERLFYKPSMEELNPITLLENEEGLQKLLRKSKVPVAVDFFAPYCVACRYSMPILEALATQYGSKLHFVKVDITGSAESAYKRGVDKIPTVILFKDGKEVKRCTDLSSREPLVECIKSIL